LGYDILKIPVTQSPRAVAAPPPVSPVWPLPRHAALSDAEVRQEFARHPFWHYAYAFEGGLSFSTSHRNPGLDTDDPVRPLQRFRHFMPYVVQAAGGSLQGKRILDIACNSGFWAIQCALLGADVVGFDARPELIAEAELLKRVTGVTTAEFRVLDFWQMRPEELGGTFDIVLNLGFLYHVAKPLEALELTKAMSRRHILLDTAVYPTDELAIYLKWEEPMDIRMAAREGMVAVPTRRAIELMLRHMEVKGWTEIPIRTTELPHDYLAGKRFSWLIEV
jgi:SAM-dependent methyltransferase